MAIQIPSNPENVAFQTAQEAEEILFRELQSLGWTNRSDVRVTPATNYSGGKWGEIPGEFDVSISHPYAIDGQTYYARVKAAPNETILKRQAQQFKHYTGDTKDVGFGGFMHVKPDDSPYYTGIQSFTRRIAAGLTRSIQKKNDYPNDNSTSWQSSVREIDDVEHMTGTKAFMPGATPDKPVPMPDNIPGSKVAHEPTASAENIRFASYTYNVPVIAPAERFGEAVQNVYKQILARANVGIKGGAGSAEQMAANPWLRLIGGGIWRPEEMKTGGRLVSGLAGGSMRVDPNTGQASLDVLAETFLKHTYSVGRRPVANLSYISGGKMKGIPEQFLQNPSLTIRAGETSNLGINVRSLTAVTPTTLPWQSGQGQVNLPTNLQRFLASEKGSLVASTPSSRRLNMQGITSVTDLTSLPFTLNQSLISGKMLSQGSQRPVSVLRADTSGIDTNTPQGKQQKALLNKLITQWSITPGNQMEQVTGYTLQYPKQWEQEMTPDQLAGHFAQLEAKGFTNFQPIAGNDPKLMVNTTTATPVGPKGYPSKMQFDLPLRGVTPQIQLQGGGSMRYDVLQEAKHLESVVFSGLRAMDEGQIPELLATIFKGNTQMIGMSDAASALISAGMPLSLQDIGSSAGFQTGEQTLLAISDAIRGYGDQQELINRFGMGYVKGSVPVAQYTPESWKELRASVVANLTMTPSSVADLDLMGIKSSQPRVLTQREAMRQWREAYSKNAQYDRDRGLYTHFANQEFFASPKLQTFHMETVGVGSTQGEYELGLEAQGYDKIRSWFGKYKNRLFPESPARWGARQITSGWMATQYGAPVEKGRTVTVTPERAQRVMDIIQGLSVAGGGDATRLQGLGDYEAAFREVFGISEKTQEEPLFYFPQSKTTIAGAGAFGTQESYLRELTAQGGLAEETQSHVSTRWMRAITGLLQSEIAGQPDLEARWSAQNLASKYIDSEQLRKRSGGTFVRYGGSSLLTTTQVGWSQRGIWRNYLMGGGNMRDPQERAQYLQTLRKVPTLGVRAPNPNIGTKGMPGSVFLMENVLPYGGRQWASAMRSMKTAGVEPYDVYLSTLSRMQQGDVDLDPGMFVPLMFRMQGQGKGQRANWVGYTEDQGDLGEWMRQITAQLAPDQQQTTFNRIFGANAVSYDPWGSRMRETIRYTMGEGISGTDRYEAAGGKSLLDKRLVLASQNIQSEIQRFNRVKTQEMGKQYNSILRRVRVAGTALGMPSEALVTASDLGIEPYQESIDLDIPDQTWSTLMQTSGFFLDQGQGLEWGWGMLGDKKNFDLGMKLTWSPTRDVSSLASDVARIMSGSKNPNAEFIASLTMNQPSRFGTREVRDPMGRVGTTSYRRSDEEMNRLIAERRNQVTQALEEAYKVGKPGSVDRIVSVNKTVEQLSKQKLIGANSIAVNALMTRALEFAKRGTTGWDAISRAMDDLGGLTIDGESVSSAEFAKKYQPQSTLYDWQRHTKGVSSYKDVLNIAELMMAAEQGGWIDTAFMREFTDQWGSLAGFNAEGEMQMTDPYTGAPTVIRNQQDIAELRQRQATNRSEMFNEWVYGGKGGIRRLSFSSLGAQAEIAQSGAIYEDMYNQSLTAAMMHGFRNPIFQTEGLNLGITAPQHLGRYYKTGGKATRQGDIVEEAYAEVQAGRLGAHIGKPRNPITKEVDFNRVGRYPVEGPTGTRYEIAGVPDFVKFARGASPGQFKVQITDVKNLPSQRGKTPQEVIESVTENPAYATQVPGYQTMFADIEWLRSDDPGAIKQREMIRDYLVEAGDKDQLQIWDDMIAGGTDVEAEGLYAVSRYKTGTKMTGGITGTKQSIGRGLDKILGGATSTRSGGGMVRVDMPTVRTADVPQRKIEIATQAEHAQRMAQELNLQGALYQSRQIKQFINADTGLIEQYGPQTVTEEEEAAYKFWTNKKQRQGETYFTQRNPLNIREDISAIDFDRLKQAVDINVAMLSGGTGVDLQQTVGTGAQRKTLEELAEPISQTVRTKQQVQKSLKRNISNLGLDAKQVQTIAMAIEAIGQGANDVIWGGGKRTGYTAGQASEFFGSATKPIFEELVGKFVEDDQGKLQWQKGRLSEQFDKMPQYLSELSGLDASTRDAVKQMPVGEGLNFLASYYEKRGISFTQALKESPGIQRIVGNLGDVETVVQHSMKDWAKLDESVTGGQDDPTMLAMRAMFLKDEGAAKKIEKDFPEAMPYLGHMREGVYQEQVYEKHSRAGGKPAFSEFGDISKYYINVMNETTSAIRKQTDALIKGKEGFQSLDELLKKTSESSDKLAEKLAPMREGIIAAGAKKWEAAVELRRKMTGVTGFDQVKAAGQDLTRDELAMIYRESESRDLLGDIKKYTAASTELEYKQYDAARVARGQEPLSGGGGAGRFGRMGRSMLGGFGLMYMRSIFDIATGGAQMGYQPYMELQQKQAQMIATQYGGLPFWTPEQELAQVQTQYAGSGWAGFQALKAKAYEDPRRAGALSMAQASIAGLGSGLWMGSMLGGPWGGILGAVGGLAAPMLVSGLQSYGASSDVIGSATGLASRLYSGEADINYLRELASKGNSIRMDSESWVAAGKTNSFGHKFSVGIGETLNRFLQEPFDPQARAAMENPEILAIAMEVENIRREREKSPEATLEEVLSGMGYDDTQIAERVSWVGTAEQGAYNIPPEGIIGAELLQNRYGFTLGREQGGAFETLAGAVAMQLPWIQGAGEIGMADPWATFEEQQRETGDLLKLWSERGGISEEDLAKLRTGAQRFSGLGSAAPDFGGAGRRRRVMQRQLGEMSAAQYGTFAKDYQMGGMRRQMGLFYNPPSADEYLGMNAEEIRQRERELGAEGIRTQQMYGVYQGMLQLGFTQPSMEAYDQMTSAQLSLNQQQVSGAFGIAQQLELAGADQGWAQNFTQALSQMQGKEGQRMLGVLSGDRQAWAEYALANPNQFAQLMFAGPLEGRGGGEIMPYLMGMTDIREGPGGQQSMTGMQWGTSSLAMPGVSSAVMAGQIWGGDYASRFSTAGGQGLIGALIEGGTFGGQLYQMERQAEYQRGMSGIQMQQIALNRSFQTGVGIGDYSGIVNPQTGQPFGFNTGRFSVNVQGAGGFTTQGGGLWGVQDAMRGLGYMQQEWGFGRQREQLAMNDRFWQQNFNINQRQAMMQRGWAREDWAFQDMQRAQQWGWKQEDFQEQSRFMTGRDRRLAERQMERQTIMYGQEGEQIDKQRERQEDLWQLEDERFRTQEQQHMEMLRFQQEGLKMQERFFEERKRLEEEQFKLSRAFQIRQMELTEQQAAASAAYAEEQAEMARIMTELSQFSQEATAQGNLFNEKTLLGIADAIEELNPELAKLIRQLVEAKSKIKTGDDGVVQDPDGEPAGEQGGKKYYQHGGRMIAGEMGYVGEAGPEKFKPYFTGDIVPSYKTNPWETTMIDPGGGNVSQQFIQLILNLGGEHFREYVLSAVDSEIDV